MTVVIKEVDLTSLQVLPHDTVWLVRPGTSEGVEVLRPKPIAPFVAPHMPAKAIISTTYLVEVEDPHSWEAMRRVRSALGLS